MSPVWWGGLLLTVLLWIVSLSLLFRARDIPRGLTRLRRAVLPEGSCCGACANLVRGVPRVHWMVKTSPQTCTKSGRCGEVQDTWAARILCYNQTVSFMDAGPGRPEGLSADPRFEYVAYSGLHDREELGTKEMWQWRYVLRAHPGVDWVAAADDDTYFLVDNILRYLQTLDPSQPMALGRRFVRAGADQLLFNSGGAGFILSRAAFAKAGPYMDACAKQWGREPGDNTAAHCWNQAGVALLDTRDSTGRERFHPFTPEQHYALREVPKNFWYYGYSTAVAPLREGPDCCAKNETLSFHYMTGKMRDFSWPHGR
mmetsp:Transcript_55304/g.171334  ORF Transcript_55304/g.171334 Transcript_55304/m.171334 type:complete len:314 (-) Transcript_55304:48-989(-)